MIALYMISSVVICLDLNTRLHAFFLNFYMILSLKKKRIN